MKPTFLKSLLLAGSLLLGAGAHAKIFDGGVDSANLGKGDWIYFISQATNKLGGNVPSVTDIPSLMAYEKSQGMNYVIVKQGTGSTNFQNQFTPELVKAAHDAGLKIFAYTRSYGDDIQGEVDLAFQAYQMGADGYVFDAESEWESGKQGTQGPTKAMQMLSMVKTNFPTKFLGHSPFPYISLHSSFPYKEFGYWCDAVMPQCYWYSIGVTPQVMVDDLDREWRNWQNGLTGQWTNSIKPIVPIGQADTATMPASDIAAFVAALKNTKTPATSGGYQGINWWRADLHEPAHWTEIAAGDVGGVFGAVNEIIVDNILATYVGTWTTASSATDKYHTDYRYKGQGTGSAYAQFRPSIWTPGTYQVYEWHSQGSNRGSDTPHQIDYAGGSTTINVNQQINGGKWNLLGSFNYGEGSGKFVRIKDNFSTAGQLAMTDALKFTYVPPSAPSAPSGLTATALASRKISLQWTDNASNEQWYVVRRSTTDGGPYTAIMTLAADSTSFIDTTAEPNTTYYYVVRAANAGGTSPLSNQSNATTFDEIIVDNPQAAVVGTWSTATSAPDKYGTDYRFKSSGTGAAYLQFTPSITSAGDYEIYEWHPAGSNRTTNAPHVITYNGGSVTVGVNQKVNGGKWNLLGTFNFATGTSGNVKIQDLYADTANVVMADALKFVMVSAGSPPIQPPSAPSSLAATAVSTSQINLTWTDNSNNEDNFIVSRGTASGGPYTDIATLGANVTSYNNTGLAAGTTYFYVVRAVNAGGSSANSNQASATTQTTPPTAPSGLTATSVSTSQINLAWTDNSNNEANFIVARSTTPGGPYSDIATLGANVTSYNNTGLATATTYYYIVRASNAAGSSSNSNEASATTQQVAAPSAPSGLTATTISQTQINLSWTDNSTTEANFIVSRSTTSGGPYTDIATLGANVTSYNNTGLSANTTYYYVVRASNAGGSSANSNQASATTLPNPPAAPGGLTATAASSSQINLSWTDNAANESNFIVARSTTAGGPYTDIATLAANTTSYNNTGLTASTTYYYVVRAVNAGGSSGNSNEASETTLPTAPAAPSGLTATPAGVSQIDLAWTDNSGNESNFIVARSITAGGPYTDIATLSANTTSYSNTGLSSGITYYYVVRASNAGGSSANSNEASASTATLPAAPDNLSALAVRPTRIDLAWADNSSNEDNFIVSRSTTPGGPYTDIATVAANTTTYKNNSGLTADTTYYYVVRAVNSAGSSAGSNEASATTLETDLLIDNQSALVVGNWSTGTAAPDKYDTDYRFIGKGVGDNSIQFTPYIVNAGAFQVYEWHSAGSNRATNAPHVISYDGGSQTVYVNQIQNGGVWNLLGTYLFTGGTNGNVRIHDGFTDPTAGKVAIADAIKLVAVPLPAAPTSLSATAVSSSRIDLTWVDNSSNEDNFIVARSTTSGGPYTDVGVLSANSTSYSDTGLSASTTYYYVVRSRNLSGSSANSNQASATTLTNQTTVTFTAVAAQDGYILESGENTNAGGSGSATDSTASALRAGDNNQDRQYRSILSFNTSTLPDNANIVSVTLKLRRGSVTGTNPFNTHGTCYVDIKGGSGFGGALGWATSDFQAAADATQVATLSNAAANLDWSTGTLNATGLTFVNKTGSTQFRVYFSLDDNDDAGNDYIGWYSGNNSTAANRPVLEVVYE